MANYKIKLRLVSEKGHCVRRSTRSDVSPPVLTENDHLAHRRIAAERAMDAALIIINLEVRQLALQVEEHVVKILAPDRADQPSINGCDSGT